jgi:hypothetical protein
LDATTVNASALSSTGAMLMSIWTTGMTRSEGEIPVEPPPFEPVDKLPARSLVIPSAQQPKRLAKLAAERSIAA